MLMKPDVGIDTVFLVFYCFGSSAWKVGREYSYAEIMMSIIFYHFYYYVDALFLQMYFEFFW